MSQDTVNEPSIESLEGLTDYIDALVESYPQPISRKQLADKVGVSKAAVTKVSDRLYSLCSPNTLIFGRKLVLRTEDVPTKLLVLYITKLRPARILNSRYGLAVLRKIGIHSKICQALPDYALYFD